MSNKDFKNKVSTIIRKDFKIRRPRIFYTKSDDLFMATLKFPFFYVLLVDKEVLNMNDRAITGCLVHELCHIENWNLSERDIDLMVINKGYGWELYEFLKYHDSIYEKYNKKDGLTKKEILKILKPN